MLVPHGTFTASQITFRPAKPTDVFRIADIHVRCWKKAYRQVFPANILNQISMQHCLATWKNVLQRKDHPPSIALLRRRIVGFVWIGTVTDPTNPDIGTGEIHGLYVQPEYWRQGIGTALGWHALSELQIQGFASAVVWCLKNYSPARQLYGSRLGMTADNEEVRFYHYYPKIAVRYHRSLT